MKKRKTRALPLSLLVCVCFGFPPPFSSLNLFFFLSFALLVVVVMWSSYIIKVTVAAPPSPHLLFLSLLFSLIFSCLFFWLFLPLALCLLSVSLSPQKVCSHSLLPPYFPLFHFLFIFPGTSFSLPLALSPFISLSPSPLSLLG